MLSAGHTPDYGVGNPVNSKSLPLAQRQLVAPTHASPEQATSITHSPTLAVTTVSERSRSNDARSPAIPVPSLDKDDPKDIILNYFLPRVAIFASADTEELVRLKGIYGGLCGLLKPFGENIPGSVVIRDSIGASKSWNNFGVHFIEFGKDSAEISWLQKFHGSDLLSQSQSFFDDPFQRPQVTAASTSVKPTRSALDEVVDRSLGPQSTTRFYSSDHDSKGVARLPAGQKLIPTYYALFLEKLLSQSPLLPHETLSHPVACVIAISSQCTTPLETLRELYRDTSQGVKKVPIWAGNEFLCYYVLVHDEDHDDITKSTALFDQMKRHFGLHCHLLRLRSVECTEKEGDGTEFPNSRWLPPEEELRNIRQAQDGGINDFRQYLFDTDAAAIKTFVREMVTQSILPFMEGRVTTWNDHVASRRRGLSGRFMSLSKRWTGFGSSRGPKAAASNPGSSQGNYDPVHGYYAPDSPEATMHRLADYAFMIRDWTLASSVYDMLRIDFGDDKAWNHHAAANEMTAISLLLSTPSTNLQTKTETVDQMLDAASYSYITRCANSQAAVRCLVLAMELYRSRGGAAVENAARWAERLLELSILSPLANGLLTERMAVCYTAQIGLGKLQWGSRLRKAAYTELLAAQIWSSLKKPASASLRLQEASDAYSVISGEGSIPSFFKLEDFWLRLQREKSDHGTGEMHLMSYDDHREGVEEFETLTRFGGSIGAPPRTFEPEGITLLQQLNDPLDQGGDGFV
ncbi:hypothetical protein MMC13_008528 [Lambiella insularis]|nr:hypothetical protein [Lambiella insularis]